MQSNAAIAIMEQEFQIAKGNEVLSWTKSDIKDKALAIVMPVADGSEDPLREYIKVRKAKEVLDEAEKNLKPFIDGLPVNKGELYYGCEVVEKELGVKYDFSKCGDRSLDFLQKRLDALQFQVDERKAFLKGLKEPLHTFDEDTGDTWTIYPPTKTGKLGKQITIK